MKGLRFLDRRVGFSMGALIVLVGMVAPAVLPSFASAAQITSRSIQMSTSQADTTANYEITFTPSSTAATDMIIYFCSNSPLAGASCTAPSNMTLVNVTSVTAGHGTPAIDTADTGNPTTNAIAIKTLSLQTGANTLTINGVKNPDAGTFYARIETFASNTIQHTAWSTGPTDSADITDNGSVAMASTNEVGVQADVLESLTFCTFGDPGNANRSTQTVGTNDSATYLSGLAAGTNGPNANCTDSNSNDGTTIELGQQAASGVLALSTAADSYGYGWTGISTNASGGAIVYMKNNSSCDGLALNGGSTCQIGGVNEGSGNHGQGISSLTAGQAQYGVSFGGGSTPGGFAAPSSSTTGAVEISSDYAGKWAFPMADSVTSTGTGPDQGVDENVDSTYGGYVYGTEGAPETNWDVPFGVGTGIAANTPAGEYSNNLSLIAVGTF